MTVASLRRRRRPRFYLPYMVAKTPLNFPSSRFILGRNTEYSPRHRTHIQSHILLRAMPMRLLSLAVSIAMLVEGAEAYAGRLPPLHCGYRVRPSISAQLSATACATAPVSKELRISQNAGSNRHRSNDHYRSSVEFSRRVVRQLREIARFCATALFILGGDLMDVASLLPQASRSSHDCGSPWCRAPCHAMYRLSLFL